MLFDFYQWSIESISLSVVVVVVFVSFRFVQAQYSSIILWITSDSKLFHFEHKTNHMTKIIWLWHRHRHRMPSYSGYYNRTKCNKTNQKLNLLREIAIFANRSINRHKIWNIFIIMKGNVGGTDSHPKFICIYDILCIFFFVSILSRSRADN